MSKSTLTIAETAGALGVSGHMVRKLVDSKQIRSLATDGKVIIPRSAVEEFLSGNTPEAVDVERVVLLSQRTLLKNQFELLKAQIAEIDKQLEQ